jgi:hypothetical protein
MADWQTISSLATAGGTLVLALATFSAVRSSNRSARVAEEALLVGMSPLLVPSLADDSVQKVLWSDNHAVHLRGGRAVLEEEGGVIYLAMALRNVGAGIAVLHGWYPRPMRTFADVRPADTELFRRLSIDLYIAPGSAGYWEGAMRDQDDPLRVRFLEVLRERQPSTIELLYGDQQGGQRTISRFTVLPTGDHEWYTLVSRHWNLDRPQPR